jgi:hypothetical protein
MNIKGNKEFRHQSLKGMQTGIKSKMSMYLHQMGRQDMQHSSMRIMLFCCHMICRTLCSHANPADNRQPSENSDCKHDG